MENLLKYRTLDYFNETDYFLLYNDGLLKYNLTKLQLVRGIWYSILGLEYKMISVPCVNSSELNGLDVFYVGTELKGKISNHHRLDDSFGVHWERGTNIRKYGLPTFWNNPINLTV